MSLHAGEGEGRQDEDAASGTAVMMSAYANAAGGVGVAYANPAFRIVGLLDCALSDLEGVVVQVIFLRRGSRNSRTDAQRRALRTCNLESTAPTPRLLQAAKTRRRGGDGGGSGGHSTAPPWGIYE